MRALVLGDVLRRFVARTLAQQFGEVFREACAPFQYALSTRAGSEAFIHAVRAAVEADPRTTVLSIDGVGAYDHISSASMLTALRDHASLASLLPFSMLFYGQASRYSFYDGEGRRHEVLQAEGGEQRDPLMPGLYALGQHAALLEMATRLSPGDKLYAFLDDVYITTKPERALDGLRASQHCLAHANVQVHLGKTRAWNAAGEEPPGLAAALPFDPANPSWVGSWALPAERQGLVVLGSPVGSRAFVEATLDQVRRKHDELLQRLPELPHLQTVWLLLLYCATPRCQYLLRTLPPAATGGFAASHDEAVLTCLATLVSGGGSTHDPPRPKPASGAAAAQNGGYGVGLCSCSPTGRILGILGRHGRGTAGTPPR